MGLGRMNVFIDIISTTPVKDAEGFATTEDTVLASVRAQKEERHGSVKWANRAVFSTATVLFRFRKIPNLRPVSSLYMLCGGERYKIVSAEDVKGRGLYYECLAELVTPTGLTDS